MDKQEQSEELYEHYHIDVDRGQNPLRIDKFLVNRIDNASRNKIQMAADAGNILVNDQAVKSSYKVKPHDSISIVMSYPPREIEIIPENIPVDIVYEDDYIIVVNKQANMVVHPGYGNYTGTLVNALCYHLKDLPLFQTGDVRPGLVHRIDKNTTGILVVGKNELAQNKLAKQFYDRTVDRRYTALVWGNLPEDEGTITGNIGRCLKNRKKMQVFPEGDHGKHAVTHYKVIERFNYVNLIECKLETGRTHQIRVHFEYIRHPLFNDSEYSGDTIIKGTTFAKYKQFVQNCFKLLPRPALHARSLKIQHPATGEELFFNSELPDDMKTVIEKWRIYTASRAS
jgi:23S rRNA pseudouridine1911/1915/1917 synthase